MKKYNLIPQEKENFCVCAVLQAIFDVDGLRVNQEDISGRLTVCEKGFKMNDDRVKTFLNEMGYDFWFYWRNETPLNEPWLVLDDMKQDHGLVGIDCHMYLFSDFDYPGVNLIDPSDGKIISKEYDEMVREMCETEGFFGLIKKI